MGWETSCSGLLWGWPGYLESVSSWYYNTWLWTLLLAVSMWVSWSHKQTGWVVVSTMASLFLPGLPCQGVPILSIPTANTLTNAPLYGPSLYDPTSLVTVPLLWWQEPGNILGLCLGVEPPSIVPSVGTHCVKTPPPPSLFWGPNHKRDSWGENITPTCPSWLVCDWRGAAEKVSTDGNC